MAFTTSKLAKLNHIAGRSDPKNKEKEAKEAKEKLDKIIKKKIYLSLDLIDSDPDSDTDNSDIESDDSKSTTATEKNEKTIRRNLAPAKKRRLQRKLDAKNEALLKKLEADKVKYEIFLTYAHSEALSEATAKAQALESAKDAEKPFNDWMIRGKLVAGAAMLVPLISMSSRLHMIGSAVLAMHWVFLGFSGMVEYGCWRG